MNTAISFQQMAVQVEGLIFLQFNGGSYFFCILQIYQFLQTELPILEAPYRYTPIRA